jgi:hypothetical protein
MVPFVIRVILPYHLQVLAGCGREVQVEPPDPVTLHAVLDALEAKYPPLAGAVRDHVTRQRRPLIRFFACEEDLSNDPLDKPLPQRVVAGTEPLFIIGAIAGGISPSPGTPGEGWGGGLAAGRPATKPPP